jgi:hypothetical protein
MIDYTLILTTKYKSTKWSFDGYKYEGLEWYGDDPKPTKEELDSQWDEVLSIKKKQDCKTQAKALLLESDWSETPSAQMDLANGGSWIVYRRELRQLFVNPIENPTWPTKPEAKWKV